MSSPKRKQTRSGLGYLYVARTQSVRSNNAEKTSRGMAHILDLSEQERPELEAEIMEHPGDWVLD